MIPERPKVSVVVITNRAGEGLAACLRSVVGQDYRPLEIVLFANGARFDVPELDNGADVPVVTGGAERNLGVAGGRNAAARLASGDLLLFLDDDAILRPGSATGAVEALRSSPQAGAVAFQLIDPESQETIVWLYPHDMAEWRGRRFDAPWVLGGAHLIRRDLFERLGGFWEGYYREMEEIDLSWRLIDDGWTIRYEPSAVIEHPVPPRRSLRYSVPSHLYMLWRLLGPGLAMRQTAFMLALFTLRALRHRELGDLFRGLSQAIRGLPRVRRERDPLSRSTVEHLRVVHASQGWGKRLQWSLRRRRGPGTEL